MTKKKVQNNLNSLLPSHSKRHVSIPFPDLTSNLYLVTFATLAFVLSIPVADILIRP